MRRHLIATAESRNVGQAAFARIALFKLTAAADAYLSLAPATAETKYLEPAGGKDLATSGSAHLTVCQI
jgi:hypothetical protein